MKQEIAFLKYRHEVVGSWPESTRKAVFLTAIESRIRTIEQQFQAAVSRLNGEATRRTSRPIPSF